MFPKVFHLFKILITLSLLPSHITPKSLQTIEELALSKLSALDLKLSKQIAYYGESCDASTKCASHLGLICSDSDSTCVCSSPDYIARLNPDKFLEKTQRRTECVLRAGSKCGIQLSFKYRQESSRDAVDAERTISAAYIWNKLRKNIPFLTEVTGGGGASGSAVDFFDDDSNCVDNAHCTGGICRCSPEHFRDDRGLCLRKRSLFQPCEDDHQCRSSEGLQCIEGKCKCAKSMVFDRVKRKCFIPVGGECDAYSSSVEMECVRNADCSNERCVCLKGYKVSSDGSCGLDHGSLCDMQANTCSDIQLTCRSGQCQCRYPVHQVYNDTLGECLSKPDGPCIPSSISSRDDDEKAFAQNCVTSAECIKPPTRPTDETNSMFEYICKCISGYAEDSAGNCVPSYSSECIEDDDCDTIIGQLTCINGRCACPDEMLTWDEPRRKCVGVVGARCRVIQFERILSFRMDVPTECLDNAVCVEHVTRLDGRCECKPGYKFSKSLLKCLST